MLEVQSSQRAQVLRLTPLHFSSASLDSCLKQLYNVYGDCVCNISRMFSLFGQFV